MQTWSPVVRQVLRLKKESANVHDMHAVDVYYENQVVGHVLYDLVPTVSAFLRRHVNEGFAKVVIGDKVNRGAGYGLEIPCTYRLYGSKPYVDRMKSIVESWHSAGYVTLQHRVSCMDHKCRPCSRLGKCGCGGTAKLSAFGGKFYVGFSMLATVHVSALWSLTVSSPRRFHCIMGSSNR